MMPKYLLTIEPEDDPTDPVGARRLRWVLKQLLRRHRCKCLAIEPVREPDDDDKLIERAVLANGEDITA